MILAHAPWSVKTPARLTVNSEGLPRAAVLPQAIRAEKPIVSRTGVGDRSRRCVAQPGA